MLIDKIKTEVEYLYHEKGIEKIEPIEADNLDEIWLTVGKDGEFLGEPCVENEHGTQFAIEDLSQDELKAFESLL